MGGRSKIEFSCKLLGINEPKSLFSISFFLSGMFFSLFFVEFDLKSGLMSKCIFV